MTVSVISEAMVVHWPEAGGCEGTWVGSGDRSNRKWEQGVEPHSIFMINRKQSVFQFFIVSAVWYALVWVRVVILSS